MLQFACDAAADDETMSVADGGPCDGAEVGVMQSFVQTVELAEQSAKLKAAAVAENCYVAVVVVVAAVDVHAVVVAEVAAAVAAVVLA